jgi:hypothetical protein
MTGTLTGWLPPRDPSGPVTCEVCGCRLTEAGEGLWRHFPSLKPGYDARGDRPACVDALHDASGVPVDPAIGSVTAA